MDFTTAQKKTARELINKALQNESRECLEKAEALLQNRKHNDLSNYQICVDLFNLITNFDKYVAKRYDGLPSSYYFTAIIGLYVDEVLTGEDLDALGEAAKAAILRGAGIFDGKIFTERF
ncbi:hypothetical protein [Candidatus Symbiothrix dinenymphae]|uniref:hypothetical protein n=1 Tax=Candidatus Symbiothrix dinenymphae TaxID=467085 RepID=UPI0007032B53|nr:hypothetical protein [Candidatus Symbiothrix dinenymphae]